MRPVLHDPAAIDVPMAPRDRKQASSHWHLELTPRLTETAGFERGTCSHINPVMPEDAAQILREGEKTEKPH